MVLDHSSLVTAQYTTEGSLKVEPSSSETFARPSVSWSVDSGLILAVNGDGCAATKNDRCYYNCQGLEIDEASQVIIATVGLRIPSLWLFRARLKGATGGLKLVIACARLEHPDRRQTLVKQGVPNQQVDLIQVLTARIPTLGAQFQVQPLLTYPKKAIRLVSGRGA